MNERIRRLGIALCLCYIAVFVMLNRIQVFGAEALNERPENVDVVRIDFARNRGTITTADGTVIAESVPVDDEFEYQRRYPTNDLFAPVTGYYSFEFGTAGLERSYQSFTQADLTTLRLAGYKDEFIGVEDGVRSYLDVLKSQGL